MSSAAPPSAPFVYRARLHEPPHDGDTVRLDIDLGLSEWRIGEPCRLLGIQAPEVSGAGVGAPEKAAGRAARDFLATFLAAKPLLIRTTKDRREGRGRYLVEVWADGAGVADAMVASGHATPYDGEGKAPKWVGPGKWVKA